MIKKKLWVVTMGFRKLAFEDKEIAKRFVEFLFDADNIKLLESEAEWSVSPSQHFYYLKSVVSEIESGTYELYETEEAARLARANYKNIVKKKLHDPSAKDNKK